MDLKQLESFVGVVRYGSFTKTAEKLYVSQPTISTHIQSLEAEFDTKLLLRDTKSIHLTDKGQELYEMALVMLKMRDRLVKEWEDEKNGVIHIGASTIPSGYILPDILPKYKEINPEIHFVIHQSDSKNVIEDIEKGAYSFAIVGMDTVHKDIVCKPFCTDDLVMVVPYNENNKQIYSEYAANPKADVLRNFILQYGMLFREEGSGSQHRAETIIDKLEMSINDIRVNASINDTESIKNLVAGGLGVAIMSERAAENAVIAKKIIAFKIPLGEAVRNLNLLHRKGENMSPHERRFMEFISSYYKVKMKN